MPLVTVRIDDGLKRQMAGIPLTWTGFTTARMQDWLDLTRDYRNQGVQLWPQLSPRTVDFRINWDSSMMFMT